MPPITQAAEAAAAKRQPADRARRGPGRPKTNHRGEDIREVDVEESSARIDEVVAAMNSAADDADPDAATDLLLGIGDTQPDTAAVPSTPTGTAPLHRASTQVGM